MMQSAGNCIGAGGGEGEEEQTFSASPHCRVFGGNNRPKLSVPPIHPPRIGDGSSRCSQYPGYQWGQGSCGILWGMSCSSPTLSCDMLGKEQDPSPPLIHPGSHTIATVVSHTRDSWGCTSAPPRDPLLLLLAATPALVVCFETSLPTSLLGGFCTPQAGSGVSLTPTPRSPGGAVGFQSLPSCRHPPRSGPGGFWGAGTEMDHRDPHSTAPGSAECHIPPPC